MYPGRALLAKLVVSIMYQEPPDAVLKTFAKVKFRISGHFLPTKLKETLVNSARKYIKTNFSNAIFTDERAMLSWTVLMGGPEDGYSMVDKVPIAFEGSREVAE